MKFRLTQAFTLPLYTCCTALFLIIVFYTMLAAMDLFNSIKAQRRLAALQHHLQHHHAQNR